MHLERTGLAQHAHQRAGVAAHDGVVDDDQPLAADDVAQRVQLQPDAELADGLAGLDERAPDVGVLHQALAVRDARALRVADRGGVPDSGVGITRSASTGASCASRRPISTRVAHAAPGDGGVRPGEVDVLEDAALRLGAAKWELRMPSASMASSSPGSTSRTKDAPTMSSAAVSLAITQPRSRRPSTSGRTPCGSRAA